ncbi:MAG: hypothetical protein ACFB51_22250 [Anaerolineae bacterium]
MKMPVRLTLLLAGSTALWIVLSFLTFRAWIDGADHRDFFPRWAGARHLLFEDGELYSDEATLDIQMELYGGPVPPDRDQQAFAYPAHIVPLLLPFWLIDDVYVAASIWVGLMLVAAAWALWLVGKAGGDAPAWAAILLLIWPYTGVAAFNAQFTFLPLAALGIGY